MKTIKARGVVLREYEAGECDKRLVLLCKEHGRLSVFAKGARKPKSKFMAAAQLFTYGDFVLADGRQFYSLAQAEVIKNFYPIRSDYNRLCHGHLLAEICEKTILESISCDQLLWLLLKSLSHLSKTNLPYTQVAAVFLFRFYLYYGLAPQVAHCCLCGTEPGGGGWFCAEGLVCGHCAGQVSHRVPLAAGAVAALRYIFGSGLPEAFLFRADENILHQLFQAGKLYWDSHFGWKLQSLAYVGA
jgi:DNA repair protein RecO (recombination protein O)